MDAFSKLVDLVIAKLEVGVVPWRRSWTIDGSWPANLATGKEYRGVVNGMVLGLASAVYGSRWWIGFGQCRDLGGHVRKGEHGTPIFLPMVHKRTDADGAEHVWSSGFKALPVFNAAQCEGLTVPATVERTHDPIDAAEAVLRKAAGRFAKVRFGDFAPCYRPGSDVICLPALAQFDSAPAYYSTLFHEVTHSTGHYSRLDRAALAHVSFGSHEYSEEELVAELGACFLMNTAGLEACTLDNSAAYLASWLRSLKAQPDMLRHAASGASKAVRWVLGTSDAEAAPEAAMGA